MYKAEDIRKRQRVLKRGGGMLVFVSFGFIKNVLPILISYCKFIMPTVLRWGMLRLCT